MFQASALASMRMPNMSCHAEEVLEASRALQVMRGREQLLRFARPRLPIQNPAGCPSIIFLSALSREDSQKKDEKGSQKFQKKKQLQITCQFQQFSVAKFCCCNLQPFANKTTRTCWSMLIHVDAICCQFYQGWCISGGDRGKQNRC